jgi:hypothetical protein
MTRRKPRLRKLRHGEARPQPTPVDPLTRLYQLDPVAAVSRVMRSG